MKYFIISLMRSFDAGAKTWFRLRPKKGVHEAMLFFAVFLIALAFPFFPRAAFVSQLDPSPYDRVFACDVWRSKDGRELFFCLLGNHGEPRARTIAVYEKKRTSSARIYLDRDRGFNPWAIEVCELDGDSLPELAVGVYKSARFDPGMKNRLFIYDFTENNVLFAKWLGSQLGLPFEAFAFANAPDGIDRLLTVEHNGRERLVLRQYHWNGFGFSHDRDRVRIKDPENYEQARDELIKEMEELKLKGVEQ